MPPSQAAERVLLTGDAAQKRAEACDAMKQAQER